MFLSTCLDGFHFSFPFSPSFLPSFLKLLKYSNIFTRIFIFVDYSSLVFQVLTTYICMYIYTYICKYICIYTYLYSKNIYLNYITFKAQLFYCFLIIKCCQWALLPLCTIKDKRIIHWIF